MTRRWAAKKNVKLTPEYVCTCRNFEHEFVVANARRLLLITHPRRSPGSVSPTGTHIIYTVSTYNLTSHSELKEVLVMNIKTRETTLFSDNTEIFNVKWLGTGTKLYWTKQSRVKETELWIGEVVGEKNAYLAGTIAAQIESVKTKPLANGSIAIAFTAKVDKHGRLFNVAKSEKPLSSAREYESVRVRFWDSYYEPELSTLWYGVLFPSAEGHEHYHLPSKFIDSLSCFGGEIEFPYQLSNEIGDDGNFAIGISGLAISTADPNLDPGIHAKETVFYIPLKTFTEENVQAIRVECENFEGSAGNPSFSPDGSHLLFTQQKALGRPVGNDRIFIVPTSELASVTEHHARLPMTMLKLLGEDGRPWDRAPGAIFWSNDMKTLYSTVEDDARVKLFKMTPNRQDDGTWTAKPVALTAHGSISSAQMLSTERNEDKIFFAYTSLVESSGYAIVDTTSVSTEIISSTTQHGALLGISAWQVSEFHAPAKAEDGDYTTQCFVVRPFYFQDGEKYPLMFLIHGGPQGSWSDAWTTRWNSAVFAEQGFVVLLPNPTGSTSFGFEYTDAILGDWGGRCYRDLEQCYNYVEKHLPYVDLSRAIVGGGSFGGYMTNWIAGQPLGQKFQALVSHDGVFSHVNMYASDSTAGIDEEIGVKLWDSPEAWSRFAPCSYTAGWTKPMLVIHSDNDYRCPVTEGLAVYNVSQARGIHSRFLNFPDENHFILKRENSLRWYSSVLGWSNYWSENKRSEVKLEEPLTRRAWKGMRLNTKKKPIAQASIN